MNKKIFLFVIIFTLILIFTGIAFADTKIYVVGGGVMDGISATGVNVYDRDTLSFINVTATYSGNGVSVVIDDAYIYSGGYGSDNVKKFDRQTLTLINETSDFGDSVYSISVDDTYLYVGGYSPNVVKKYNKDTLEYINETPDYGGAIRVIFVDNNYIYIGGYANILKRYDKTTMAYVDEASNYGGKIYAITTDDNYIYAGGYTTQTVKKYDISTLAFVDETASYGGNILSIKVDDNYIYVGGAITNKVRRYNKSSMDYIDETASYGGQIESVFIDANHIYTGGRTTNTVRKYDKSTLVYINETVNYGGYIYSISGFECEVDNDCALCEKCVDNVCDLQSDEDIKNECEQYLYCSEDNSSVWESEGTCRDGLCVLSLNDDGGTCEYCFEELMIPIPYGEDLFDECEYYCSGESSCAEPEITNSLIINLTNENYANYTENPIFQYIVYSYPDTINITSGGCYMGIDIDEQGIIYNTYGDCFSSDYFDFGTEIMQNFTYNVGVDECKGYNLDLTQELGLHNWSIICFDELTESIINQSEVRYFYITEDPECLISEDCSLCMKCADNVCVNQTTSEDIKNECSANCNGNASCEIVPVNETGYVPTYRIGDLAPITVDGIGIAGVTTVDLIGLIALFGVIAIGIYIAFQKEIFKHIFQK